MGEKFRLSITCTIYVVYIMGCLAFLTVVYTSRRSVFFRSARWADGIEFSLALAKKFHAAVLSPGGFTDFVFLVPCAAFRALTTKESKSLCDTRRCFPILCAASLRAFIRAYTVEIRCRICSATSGTVSNPYRSISSVQVPLSTACWKPCPGERESEKRPCRAYCRELTSLSMETT